LAARAREQLPAIGDEIELTLLAAARAGGDSASLFDEIGSLAIAQSEVRREVRIATAPGRATAAVLVAAPAAYLIFQARSGGLVGMLAESEQRMVAVLGMGLFVTGLIVALLVLWRGGK
jgi:Flp pilus assembly protein TadB